MLEFLEQLYGVLAEIYEELAKPSSSFGSLILNSESVLGALNMGGRVIS